jgi:hypothetical protein
MNAVIKFPVQQEKTAAQLADEMGLLAAEIKPLTDRLDQIKQSFREMGESQKHSGEFYAVSVSKKGITISVPREKLEAKLRELGVDQNWFDDNSEISERASSVTCKAVK